MTNLAKDNTKMRVFAHVAYGFGACRWNTKFRAGKLAGVNEPYAYGYHRASQHGCDVVYSTDHPEYAPVRYFRLLLRVLLKFDLLHAWRNRRGIFGADVVWTHTESQHAAILLLFLILPSERRPKLIAQSVWLFDRWSEMPFPNRWLFRILLSRADILTVLSSENLQCARELFPNVRSELVLFGIRADEKSEPRHGAVRRPIRVISLGNDEHRDWTTLISAAKSDPDIDLRIASHNAPRNIHATFGNIAVVRLETYAETISLYGWADIMVVSLKPNLHVSGITVIQEAALLGVPVICSDIPGLRDYFSDNEVIYIHPGKPEAIRQAIRETADNDDVRYNIALRAQARMGSPGLSAQSYVARHVEISRELLIGKKR